MEGWSTGGHPLTPWGSVTITGTLALTACQAILGNTLHKSQALQLGVSGTPSSHLWACHSADSTDMQHLSQGLGRSHTNWHLLRIRGQGLCR